MIAKRPGLTTFLWIAFLALGMSMTTRTEAIEQLVAKLDLNATIPLDTIAYKFDIVLRGRRSTLFENRLEGN